MSFAIPFNVTITYSKSAEIVNYITLKIFKVALSK